MFSVHGSKILGNRTAKSPSAIVQLERTISECEFSTTVKRSWRFASLKTIHLEHFHFIIRHRKSRDKNEG